MPAYVTISYAAVISNATWRSIKKAGPAANAKACWLVVTELFGRSDTRVVNFVFISE